MPSGWRLIKSLITHADAHSKTGYIEGQKLISGLKSAGFITLRSGVQVSPALHIAPGSAAGRVSFAPAMRIYLHDYGGHAFIVGLARRLAERGHAVRYGFSATNEAPQGDLAARPSDAPGFSLDPVVTAGGRQARAVAGGARPPQARRGPVRARRRRPRPPVERRRGGRRQLRARRRGGPPAGGAGAGRGLRQLAPGRPLGRHAGRAETPLRRAGRRARSRVRGARRPAAPPRRRRRRHHRRVPPSPDPLADRPVARDGAGKLGAPRRPPPAPARQRLGACTRPRRQARRALLRHPRDETRPERPRCAGGVSRRHRRPARRRVVGRGRRLAGGREAAPRARRAHPAPLPALRRLPRRAGRGRRGRGGAGARGERRIRPVQGAGLPVRRPPDGPLRPGRQPCRAHRDARRGRRRGAARRPRGAGGGRRRAAPRRPPAPSDGRGRAGLRRAGLRPGRCR